MFKRLFSTAFGTFIGIPVSILLIIGIIYIPSQIIDAAYKVSLFVPTKLGIITPLTIDEILEIDVSQENTVYLSRRGRYRIYSEERFSLARKITLISEESSDIIDVVPLFDGFADSRIDRGDPQYVFSINSAGSYKIVTNTSAKNGTVIYTIIPYLGNIRATIAIVGGIIQIAVIAFFFNLIYKHIHKDQIKETIKIQGKKREQFEIFLDNAKKDKP